MTVPGPGVELVAIAQLAEEETTRVCRRCDQTRAITDFRRHTHGRRHICRYCRRRGDKEAYKRSPEDQRWAQVKYRYGLTKEGYEELLAKQDGKCAICGSGPSAIRKATGQQYAFHIDHDHETGVVRGLLCLHCNNGLGHFRDSARVLASAMAYLERSE